MAVGWPLAWQTTLLGDLILLTTPINRAAVAILNILVGMNDRHEIIRPLLQARIIFLKSTINLDISTVARSRK